MQNGLHCKVECNTEIRRFLFTGTEFHSLYGQVKTLLSIQKEFVLKYKDEEGDLITISTDEELTFAKAGLLPSQALRLVVCNAEVVTKAVEIKDSKRARKGHGPAHVDGIEAKKKRITACLEKLQGMPPTEGKDAWRLKKIERLQAKLAMLESLQTAGLTTNDDGHDRRAKGRDAKKQRITAKIERLSAVPPSEGNFEGRQKKIEHLKMKLAWLDEAGERKEWSPEQKAKFEEKKAQRKAVKEQMFALREQMKLKKSEYYLAPEQSKGAVEKEIKDLKEQIFALKNQLVALKFEGKRY